MDKENNHMEDSCEVEYVCGEPKRDVHVGDEYQVEIPPMMSESERAVFLLNPLDSGSSCSSCSLVVGHSVEVMWIDTKYGDRQRLADDNVDMNESLKSLRTKRSRRGESDGNRGFKKQKMNLEAVPEKSSSSWEDLEVDGFVLGLYTFGKDFTLLKKFLGSKETGETLSFYYGKFYKSAKYKIWYNSLKKRSRRCIQGNKLYSGWRLHKLLSRLIPSIADEEKKKKLVNVSKSFAEGNKSLEEYIGAVKELVGLRALVEAVAIGKDREDLSVLTTEPVNSKHWFTISSGLGTYSKLTADEIIEKLNCGSRLSKARCNDLFWEAVWPRLLARGWNSEQPKDQGYNKSRDYIVFLVPGVQKFIRRKHVKHDHYFDSISDILDKVASEPELLEIETPEIRASDGFIGENIRDQSNHGKHRYLRSPDSDMKFTVVDTTSLALGGKLCEFRELKNPNPEPLVSQPKGFRGDNKPSVERLQMMPLDIQKRAKFDDERAEERRRMKKLIDDPIRFMIVDTSVEHGEQSFGIRKRRHLPVDESPCRIRKSVTREVFGESSQKKQSGANTDVRSEYPKGTCSGVKEETMESVQQGRSKKRSARKSESNNHNSGSSLPLPKRRRLSACVRKDIKRSGESSLLKPHALEQTTTNCDPKLSVDYMSIKTEPTEETGNGISLHVELQVKKKNEPNGLCPSSETVHELSSSAQVQQKKPNGFCSISALDKHCSSMEQETLHELSSLEQQKQQEEKLIQLPPSNDHGTCQEREEEQKQQTNEDIPRRQSTRKRPLTTRALEALESSCYIAQSIKSTPKPRKRERSTKIKHSASASNRTQGESGNGFLVKDSRPSFLVNEATRVGSKAVNQIEDSKQVTTEFPKLPPIVLKLPFKRG